MRNLKNLAGVKTCDEDILEELKLARIPVEHVAEWKKYTGEVPYTKIGRLGGFEFRRAWTYWMVKCRVPMNVAREIYADPVCASDVRAGGHCGCVPPDTVCNTYDQVNGLHVIKQAEYDRCKNEPLYAELIKEFIGDEDATKAGHDTMSYVTCYHIDSLLGLQVFVDYLRAHGLVLK